MAATLEADYNDTSFPLELVIDLIGSGGVPGLAPTVAVRLFPSVVLYLDWTTLTFKAAGWGVKNQPMVDLGNGIYQAVLNVAGLGFTPKTAVLPQKLVAEYTSMGAQTSGIDYDVVIVSELRPDAKRARQYATNRLEALGGNPGSLTLFDDDNATTLTTQTLHDYTGGTVIDTPGTPAKRGGT